MALYYTAHLEWFNQYLSGQPPPWTTEQFLRNAVFDKTTGQRIVETETEHAVGRTLECGDLSPLSSAAA